MASLVKLEPDCSIKLLEEPCLYNRTSDELYIVNEKALDFLAACYAGTEMPEGREAAEFVDYCLEEGLMRHARQRADRSICVARSPSPSLRYLLLHITDRCNLRCRHCFLGDAGMTDLPVEDIRKVVDEFERLQGLRLIVSGGEPLKHRGFWEVNDYLAGKDVRTILLSNGTLIDGEAASRLGFTEVQISLDGMKDAHEYLRGPGTFDQAMRAILALLGAGMQVSVATMIHRKNLRNFNELAGFIGGLGVREWRIDLPSGTGRIGENLHIMADPKTAGPLLDYSFGGAVHEPAGGYACGPHLMAVMADGDVSRCGFYAGEAVGTIREALADCWERIDRVRLDQLECDCEHKEVCRGGCRFRAAGYNHAYGPDLCQCYRYGALK